MSPARFMALANGLHAARRVVDYCRGASESMLDQLWTAGIPKMATGTKAANAVRMNLETVKTQAIYATTQCGNSVPPSRSNDFAVSERRKIISERPEGFAVGVLWPQPMQLFGA
jgi:hypothetical protein